MPGHLRLHRHGIVIVGDAPGVPHGGRSPIGLRYRLCTPSCVGRDRQCAASPRWQGLAGWHFFLGARGGEIGFRRCRAGGTAGVASAGLACSVGWLAAARDSFLEWALLVAHKQAGERWRMAGGRKDSRYSIAPTTLKTSRISAPLATDFEHQTWPPPCAGDG